MSTSDHMVISADEVNCLIYSYFRDSGLQHSAFTLHSEAQLHMSPHANRHIPRGELVDLLSKALLYIEAEKHWRGRFTCRSGFSLLERHVCEPELPRPISKPTADLLESQAEHHSLNGGAEGITTKRKATPPLEDEGRSDKRAKMEQNDANALAAESSESKATVKKPFDITTVAGGSYIDQTTESRPLMPVDKETDPSAIQLLTGHIEEVFVCAWNPVNHEQLATGSKDATVNIWTIPSYKGDAKSFSIGMTSLKQHFGGSRVQGDMTSIDWNCDGSLLAMGSYDSVLRIANASGDLYMKDRTHKGPIFATKFSKNSRWLLTASLDGTVCLWSVWEKKLHMQYKCHTDCCLDVDWLDENTFASCGADSVIHIMRLEDAAPIKTLSGHESEINQIKSNPSKTRLASCADDETARIWNIADLTDQKTDPSYDIDRVVLLKGHKHAVSSIGWCPQQAHGQNELVATSSFDGTARLWDTESGVCLKIFSDHIRPVYAQTFSPDGHWLATGGGDGYLHIYHVKDGKRKWSWYAGSEKPGVFEIDWQISGKTNRIALALECRFVGVIDVTRVPALRESPSSVSD